MDSLQLTGITIPYGPVGEIGSVWPWRALPERHPLGLTKCDVNDVGGDPQLISVKDHPKFASLQIPVTRDHEASGSPFSPQVPSRHSRPFFTTSSFLTTLVFFVCVVLTPFGASGKKFLL